MSEDLIAKLMSQVGDDVHKIYEHEALFKSAAAHIRELEGQLDVERSTYEDVLRDNKRKSDRIEKLEAENAALRYEADPVSVGEAARILLADKAALKVIASQFWRNNNPAGEVSPGYTPVLADALRALADKEKDHRNV